MSQPRKAEPMTLQVTAGDVRHVAGPVTDNTVAAVLSLEPSMEELEVAGSYLRGEGSKVDRRGHPMTGKVAQLYDVLTADVLYAEGEE
jgi:hypothetical protein